MKLQARSTKLFHDLMIGGLFLFHLDLGGFPSAAWVGREQGVAQRTKEVIQGAVKAARESAMSVMRVSKAF